MLWTQLLCPFYSQGSHIPEIFKTWFRIQVLAQTTSLTWIEIQQTLLGFYQLYFSEDDNLVHFKSPNRMHKKHDPEILVCVVAEGWEHSLSWYSGQRHWMEGIVIEMLMFFVALHCKRQWAKTGLEPSRCALFTEPSVWKARGLTSKSCLSLLSPASRLYRESEQKHSIIPKFNLVPLVIWSALSFIFIES